MSRHPPHRHVVKAQGQLVAMRSDQGQSAGELLVPPLRQRRPDQVGDFGASTSLGAGDTADVARSHMWVLLLGGHRAIAALQRLGQAFDELDRAATTSPDS